MSWVIYSKFLSAGKFVLIEYLTLIYIFAYFCDAIWLFYQLIIHACFEANFWGKKNSANFSSSFRFLVWSIQTDLFLSVKCSNGPILTPDESSLVICWPSSYHPDGISTGLRLASLSLPYTHLCIFIDLLWHVMCFSCGFLPRFWHSLHISSHPMIFIMSSVILLSVCAFRILKYFLGYFLEIVCMKILFCLCVGLILIYIYIYMGNLDCDLCFCNTWASNWQLSWYHFLFRTNRI